MVITTGYYGQHFGYTVDGVPHGSAADSKEWQDYPYFSDQLIFGFWEHQATGTDSSVVGSTLAYLGYFTTFNVDGVPAWLTFVFDLIILLAFVLIFTLIRGGE